MDERFIVLRRVQPIAPEAGGRFPMAGPAGGQGGAESLEVHEVALNEAERADVRRDPRTQGIARSMPMQLIAPVAADGAAGPAAGPATWGVGAVRATDSPFDGSGITVAVLDTGIDPVHPAFDGVSLERKNFTNETDDDINGHGTHCAGTIFGQDVNGTRIGIARNVERALIGKVLGQNGGSSLDIVHAIRWAVREGAQVISMSLSIDFPGYVQLLVEEDGLDIRPATSIALEAYRANVNLFTTLASSVQAGELFGQSAVLIAAAGNEAERDDFEIAAGPPAAGTGTIAVGALRETAAGLDIAPFSNNQVDIAAPGSLISSARLGGGLKLLSGTSMAAPHVAGIAALWAQRLLERTGRVEVSTLTAQLIASGTFTPLVDSVKEDDVGTGIVQAPLN